MSETVSRLTDRGRRFLNKHVLKQPVVPPARPQTAAPQIIPPVRPQTAVPRNHPPARPLTPAPAQRPGSALPRDGLAIPHDGAYSGLSDRVPTGNDSPEESSQAERIATGPIGDDSPEEAASYETVPTMAETTEPSALVSNDLGPQQNPSNYILQGAPSNYIAGSGSQFSLDNLSESSSESSSEEELDVEEKYAAKPHAKIDAAATPTGMKAKPVGAEYAGEHNKVGWRGTTPQAAEQTHVATRLFNEQEQRQNELVMGKDGQFTKDGGSVAGGQLGYVMDAAGRMVAFKETDNQIATTDTDGNTTKEETSDGHGIMTGHRKLPANQRLETIHHSSVLGGDAVVGDDGAAVLDAKGKPVMRSRPAASAGFVEFDWSGKIIKISNSSGHYKPSVDYLAQAIEHLLKQGAFFKDEVTDADGNRLKRNSKEAQLYVATQAKLTEAGKLAERVAGLTEALAAAEEKQDEEAQAALGTRLKEAAGKLDALKKKVDEAKAVLGKLGVGPSNRVRQEVQASYLDVKAGMTGAAIRTAPTKTMPVYNFLKTGGGNSDQAALKMELGQEILRLKRFKSTDYARMTELGKKDPLALSGLEAKELAKLSQRWKIAESGMIADKEATQRSEAAAGGGAAAPNVDAALAGLGVQARAEDDSSSESDSDSDSSSEEESESRS